MLGSVVGERVSGRFDAPAARFAAQSIWRRATQKGELFGDVGSQVFASDGAPRGALNIDAPLHWHTTLAARPLVNQYGGDADFPSEIGLSETGEKVVAQSHGSYVSSWLTDRASSVLIANTSNTLSNCGMTNDEIRRENLRNLIEETGGVGKFAAMLGISSAQVSQWKNASPNSKTGKPRKMQDDTARRIEECCGKPRGWMDHRHTQGDDAAHSLQPLQDAGIKQSTRINAKAFAAPSLTEVDAVIAAVLKPLGWTLAQYRSAMMGSATAAESHHADATGRVDVGYDRDPDFVTYSSPRSPGMEDVELITARPSTEIMEAFYYAEIPDGGKDRAKATTPAKTTRRAA